MLISSWVFPFHLLFRSRVNKYKLLIQKLLHLFPANSWLTQGKAISWFCSLEHLSAHLLCLTVNACVSWIRADAVYISSVTGSRIRKEVLSVCLQLLELPHQRKREFWNWHMGVKQITLVVVGRRKKHPKDDSRQRETYKVTASVMLSFRFPAVLIPLLAFLPFFVFLFHRFVRQTPTRLLLWYSLFFLLFHSAFKDTDRWKTDVTLNWVTECGYSSFPILVALIRQEKKELQSWMNYSGTHSGSCRSFFHRRSFFCYIYCNNVTVQPVSTVLFRDSRRQQVRPKVHWNTLKWGVLTARIRNRIPLFWLELKRRI